MSIYSNVVYSVMHHLMFVSPKETAYEMKAPYISMDDMFFGTNMGSNILHATTQPSVSQVDEYVKHALYCGVQCQFCGSCNAIL